MDPYRMNAMLLHTFSVGRNFTCETCVWMFVFGSLLQVKSLKKGDLEFGHKNQESTKES